MTVGHYLRGDSLVEHRAPQYASMAERDNSSGRGLGIRRGFGEWSAEPRDPLKTSILGGDRDEYIDKSFWHDAEATGITFDESRVDGIWDEASSEMWK